jgi:membrane protein implicated in regulation of membrane protease activity
VLRRAPRAGSPVRWSVLAAVTEAWLVVALAALATPHLLLVFVALAAVYTVAAPPYLRRHLDRRVEERSNGSVERIDGDVELVEGEGADHPVGR